MAAVTAASITASVHNSTQSATLTLNPPVPASLTLNPQSVAGGSPSTATLTLSGPAPQGGLQVAISSSNAAASAPGSVTVAASSSTATFTVQTLSVVADTSASITASANAAAQQATLLVRAARLSSVSLAPNSITGGDPATLTVSLDGPAPAGGVVVILTSDRAEVSVPGSVSVSAGSSSASLTLTTSAVSATTVATITASYGGSTRSALLTLNPQPVALGSLSLSPSTVVGGLPVTGTLTLTAPAPPSGVVVALSSEDASVAAVPATVTVAPGAISASFPVSTTTILTSAQVTLTATYNLSSKSALLTVQPPSSLALLSITIDPANVAGGSGATGTVTLTAPAPNGGAEVALSSSDPATVIVASGVKVKGGDSSATFTISTLAVTSIDSVDVAGSYGGLTQHASLVVIPQSALTLVRLTLNPSTLSGGSTGTGTVTMSAPAPAGGVVVSIAVKHRNVASAPSSILVPGGATSASFPIAAERVHSAKTTDISTSYASLTRTATLTVTPPTALFHVLEDNPSIMLSVRAEFTALSPQSAPPAGRRISLYTPELNLMAETEVSTASTPAVTSEYIWFGGSPVAQLESSTGAVHYTFTDHLGTPIVQTDSTGTIDWRAEYEPYGSVYSFRAGAERRQPLRLPGQEVDDGDREYNIFRWYRAGWGRYTQPDPLLVSETRAEHEYLYVSANPVRSSDPVGLFSIDGTCDGMDCQPSLNPQQTQRAQLYDETRGLCRVLDTLITDPALRRCIKRSCERGKIACTDPTGDCKQNRSWGAYSVVGSLKQPSRTVHLCLANWGPGIVVPGQLGDIVIHEWAHGCGWKHGQGGGVPRDPGAAGGGR